MTKETNIKNYRRFSGADSYILGFELNGKIYFIKVNEIAPRYMKMEKESSKNGGGMKLQLRIKNAYKTELMKKGVKYLCDLTDLENENKNKGVAFENLIYRFYGLTPRAKDNIGFWLCGDINVDGEEIQIKFNGAQIATEKTLKRLVKENRGNF